MRPVVKSKAKVADRDVVIPSSVVISEMFTNRDTSKGEIGTTMTVGLAPTKVPFCTIAFIT
jgi:hypothetical protein